MVDQVLGDLVRGGKAFGKSSHDDKTFSLRTSQDISRLDDTIAQTIHPLEEEWFLDENVQAAVHRLLQRLKTALTWVGQNFDRVDGVGVQHGAEVRIARKAVQTLHLRSKHRIDFRAGDNLDSLTSLAKATDGRQVLAKGYAADPDQGKA